MPDFQQLLVPSGSPRLLADAGGPVLLTNEDLLNTVWLSDDPFDITPDGDHAAPLAPLGTITVDGSIPIYGLCEPGLSAMVSIVPTAVSQAVSPAQIAAQIALKSLTVSVKGQLDWTNVTLPPFNADPTGLADSTSAVIAATAAGAPVYFPAGTYLLNPALLTIAQGMAWIGDGYAKTTLTFTSPLSMQPAAQVNDMEIAGLTIQATGVDLFQGANIARLHLHDCALIQNSAGNSIWNAPALVAMIECRFERNKETVKGAIRTAPAWSLTGTGGGQVNQSIWRDEVCFNNDNDASQYWYVLDAANAGGQTHAANTFQNIVFEHPMGGQIKLLSCTGTTLSNCVCWDLTANVASSLIYIGKDAANPTPSQHNYLVMVNRRGGNFALGQSDIQLESTCLQTTIDTCGRDAGGTAYTIDLGNSTGNELRNLAPLTIISNDSNWQSMTTRGYQHGWADGPFGSPGRYRLTKDNQLQLDGVLTGGTLTDSTVIINLPNAYHPANTKVVPMLVPGSGAAANMRFELDNNGNLLCLGISGLGALPTIIIPSLTIPLD